MACQCGQAIAVRRPYCDISRPVLGLKWAWCAQSMLTLSALRIASRFFNTLVVFVEGTTMQGYLARSSIRMHFVPLRLRLTSTVRHSLREGSTLQQENRRAGGL